MAGSPAIGADSSVVFGSYDGSVYCLRDVQSRDLTPPTTPIVNVTETLLPLDEPIEASWSASDPDTMVAEYMYAVGTAPEETDVLWWTSAGIETSAVIDDLNLVSGQTYYVLVKARNPSRRWSEIGVSEPILISSAASSNLIGDIKGLADNEEVTLESKVVTAVFSDCFFIEETNRASGIRCVEADSGLAAGDIVDINGILNTVNGEKVISGASHTYMGHTDVPSVLGLCGNAAFSNSFCPLGLLVKVWGKVITPGATCCTINTGAGGIRPAGEAVGIEVWADVADAGENATIAATGIICREVVGDQVVTVVRVPETGEVVVVD